MTLDLPMARSFGGLLGNNSGDARTRPAGFIRGYAQGGLVVEVTHADGQFVATSSDIAMFGEGHTPDDAVRDFVHSLGALHRELAEDPGALSPELAAQLALLEDLGVSPMLAVAG